MRYALIGCLLMALVLGGGPAAAETPVVRLSEPVVATDEFEDFGAPLPAQPRARRLVDVLADTSLTAGVAVTVTARIDRVCQKKGCFFIAQDGPAMARVEFKDYGFFVPTDSAGKTVTLIGEVRRQTLSAERAAHLDADSGGEGLHQPGTETVLIASAVRIPLQR